VSGKRTDMRLHGILRREMRFLRGKTQILRGEMIQRREKKRRKNNIHAI
jgi:hypothetical protein